MFFGSLVALVTPMLPSGEIDYSALDALVDWHLHSGTDGLVILGTTGECTTISESERQTLIPHVLKRVNNRIPVIVGTGSNSTSEALTRTSDAQSMGADACLIITPYYNKPTQAGLYAHFARIAENTSVPQILYNVPSRTGIDLGIEVTQQLDTDFPHVIGLKDATADFSRLRYLLEHTNLELYSGDDLTALDFIHAGGRGVISVTANVAPKAMHEMTQCLAAGDLDAARQINKNLLFWHKMLFIESNPIPTKWVLSSMGKLKPGIRLPLTWLSEDNQLVLKNGLNQCNYI